MGFLTSVQRYQFDSITQRNSFARKALAQGIDPQKVAKVFDLSKTALEQLQGQVASGMKS